MEEYNKENIKKLKTISSGVKIISIIPFFKNSPHYRQMVPPSHQSARLFATAKTQKFGNINDITIDILKLYRPNRNVLGK